MIFTLNKTPSLAKRLWINFGVPVLAVFVGLVIGYTPFYLKFMHEIHIALIIFLALKASSPRSRIILKLEFDDSQSMLRIFYNQYVFYYNTVSISYKNTLFKYRYKIFRRGDIPKTLEIFKSGKYIGEIRENNKIGWTKEDLEAILRKLNL